MDNSDCPAPSLCDQSLHRCSGGTDGDLNGDPDGDVDGDEDDVDGDMDGDLPDGDSDGDVDGDGDADGDQIDGDLIVDGDLEVDQTDGDQVIDGDTADGDVSDVPPAGASWLIDIQDLPYFRPMTVARQFSSRDPSGGNQDRSYTNLYIDGAEQVLMETRQPGCLYRIWLGMPAMINGYKLRFYFDGEDTPRINETVNDLFGGATAPFLSPLVGQKSESYYSYVPICYEEGLKVTLSGTAQGYNFTYHSVPASDAVEPFSWDMDMTDTADFYTNHVGEDPKPTEGNDHPSPSPVSISPDETRTVFPEVHDSGVINALKIDISPAETEILDNTYLQIFWEGKSTPDVNVPIGLFFGSGFGQIDFSSLLVGMSTSGEWYSYFPMPYWDSFVIKVKNESSLTIDQFKISLELGENNYPRTVGHFYASYSEKTPTTSGNDFYALDTSGKGHVVGLSLAMESDVVYTKEFLEGDERIVIDGMNSPVIYGTGTDAFFNGNNRWQTGVYDNPLFSIWKNDNPTWQFTARRLMPGDAIPFEKSIQLGFEHGGENTVNANYRAVAYYYMSCLEGLTFSDSLDVMDAPDENDHYFASDLETSPHTNTRSVYEGENDDTEVIDSGRGIIGVGDQRGQMVMTFAIDSSNVGVRLIRRLDQKYGRQEALVFVDDEPVGYWYNPVRNESQRWRDSLFDIPAEYTEGKSSIEVRFQWAGGDEWNAYQFWVYSHLPISSQTEGPGMVTSIDYTLIGPTACLSWAPPSGGPPPSIYHIYRSTAQLFECDENSHIGQTSTTDFCDETSLPQTQYYYRIKAEDCTGAQGVCSESLGVLTGIPAMPIEAEDYYDPNETWQDRGEEQPFTGASNNAILFFDGADEVQRLVLKLDAGVLEYEGDYRISVVPLHGPSMAQWQMIVDSRSLGEVYDAYEALPAGTMQLGERVIMGDRHLRPFDSFGEPRDLYIVFQTEGKNAASSSYDIGIDVIYFEDVNQD